MCIRDRDPLDAMAVLTPQMIEGIFYLKKALNVPTALYFTGNAMFVFMALARETFDVSDKNTLLEDSRLLKRDIALMTGFMDVMYFCLLYTSPHSRQTEGGNKAPSAGTGASTRLVQSGNRLRREKIGLDDAPYVGSQSLQYLLEIAIEGEAMKGMKQLWCAAALVMRCLLYTSRCV